MATLVSNAPAQAAPAFSVRSILAPLVAIILGLFMVLLDNTVVNAACQQGGVVAAYKGGAHAHRGDQGYYTHSNPGRR